MIEFEVAELNRRLANIIRIATVAEIDYNSAKVIVEIGELRSDWLPWLTSRAGNNVTWSAPDIGEQVVVMAPSGDLSQAVIMSALYQNNFPAQENTGDVHAIEYGDGTKISYNRQTHNLDVVLCTEGSTNIETNAGLTIIAQDGGIQVTGDTTITGAVDITGDVTITGKVDITGNVGITGTLKSSDTISSESDVLAAGISLKSHIHTGDSGGKTKGPE